MTPHNDKTKYQFELQASNVATPPIGEGAVFGKTDKKPYWIDSDGTVLDLSAGASAAPNSATFITQTPSSGLSAEQALSLLATGLMRVTTTTGVITSVALTTIITYARFLVHDETLGSNGSFDVDLTSIDSPIQAETGDLLELRISARAATAAVGTDVVYLFWNNDTTVANYRVVAQETTDSSMTDTAVDNPNIGNMPAATADANEFAQFTVFVPFYGGAHRKIAQIRDDFRASSTVISHRDTTHSWENTAAITRLQIRTDNHATDLLLTGSRLQIIVHKAQALATGAVV